ncbi:hypothetical protein PL963_02858 [Pseudomonas cerasi]|uniref:Uncharacterized protein n=1 Tax=Pseudomonas cerasi TaxID=1583341 RepID=A0A2K4VBM1_9PSED|nr:hypothetical protein PL963_02858 [Pseudomonas cerasi]
MMIDWLTVSQEHDHDLPVVCDVFTLTIRFQYQRGLEYSPASF